ncbi:MAG: HAMP domain-containing protein [Candidatus Stahlbacteria bacterium]|nr:HAMP domain-containing protein [Candidatus Stahlbacteria bacterium]
MKSFSSQLIIAFGLILVLVAIVPLSIFTFRVAPFNLTILENKEFEQSLELSIANAKTPSELTLATNALQEYRQLDALRKPLRREFIGFGIILVTLLFLISIGIIIISVNQITKPLKSLVEATKQIADGNTSITLKPVKSGEFNMLITAFNSMVRSLNETQYKLRLAERHSAWQEMARMLAHEIKNPLTPIKLSIQRLREKYLKNSADLPEVIDKTIKIIEAETNNFINLVERFSEFAHLPPPKLSPKNINTIVKDCVAVYAVLPEVKFDEQYDNSIPDIMVDDSQIKQVIGNIIKNATEAKNMECVIQVITKTNENEVEITIADNGKGIPNEDMNRVFHPYFTTKEKGTGLGLVITERIITEHNGKISVESKEGIGTKVSIKLPIRSVE